MVTVHRTSVALCNSKQPSDTKFHEWCSMRDRATIAIVNKKQNESSKYESPSPATPSHEPWGDGGWSFELDGNHF